MNRFRICGTNVDPIYLNEDATKLFAEINVTDTGVGIASDKLAQLFELGKIETTHGTKGETGTGLGLILCKEFIEIDGGTLTVEGSSSKGSTFRFTLPTFER